MVAVEAVASEAVSGLGVPRNPEKQGIIAVFEPFRRIAAAYSEAFSVAYAENSLRKKQGILPTEQGSRVSAQGLHT